MLLLGIKSFSESNLPQNLRDHSKMTSPRKDKILDPPPPHATIIFFIIPPLPMSPGK